MQSDVSVCPLFPQNNTVKHNLWFISYLAEWKTHSVFLSPAKQKTTMKSFYALTIYDFLISLGGPNGLSALQNYT